MSTLDVLLKRELAKLPKQGSEARIAFDKMKEAEPPVSDLLRPKLAELIAKLGIPHKLSAAKTGSGHSDLFIKDTEPKQTVGFVINNDAFLDPLALGMTIDKLSWSFRMQVFILVQGKPVIHVTPQSIVLEVYKEGKESPLATSYAAF